MPVDPPIGSITAYAGPVINYNESQENYLICDGRRLDRNTHPALFSVIGTTWGGDGAPFFFLPDLRGQFLRGVDKSKDGTISSPVNDPERDSRTGFRPPPSPNNPGNSGNDVGSFQDDSFESHGHGVTDNQHTHEVKRGFLADGSGGYGHGGHHPGGSDVHDFGDRKTTTASASNIRIQANGGLENRPKNAYVYWLIRYR